MAADREFLFTYRWRGAEWGISIFADDATEAREKIKQVALARYDGECMGRIPATIPGTAPPVGLLARLICWWKNRGKR